MRRTAVFCGVVSLALVSCSSGDNDATSAEGPSKVTVKTSEYRFELPPSFKGGLVELTLDNASGKESHEAELIRLDAGKGLADIQAAFQQGGHPPDWAHLTGGPGPTLPGKSTVYTGNLAAGVWALICRVPAPDGKEHTEKGMLAQASVTEGPTGSLPESDATITASEFKFSGYEGLKAGTQTVRVTNEGQDHHHFIVFSLAPGTKAADALSFIRGQSRRSPITGRLGLVGTMSPGLQATRTLELATGQTYMLACFISDDQGTPHAFRGMVAEFTL